MDHPQDDRSLLTHYARTRSADAFNAIVKRHAGMVYASAKRQVRRADLAEEVTQAVFILLYRKAHTLDERTVLAAWLFRTARYAARNALRAERRREHHERKAAFRTEPMRTNDAMWQDVHPVLDEAIAKLSDADRDVIVLRYLEQRSYADVSRALRISIEAAQMRAKRAIDRLRDILRRRGITITATALGGLVMSRAAEAAPASVVQSIAHATTGDIEAPIDYPLADETARALWWDAIRGQAVVAAVAMALTLLCCVSAERAIVRVGEWYRTPPVRTPSPGTPGEGWGEGLRTSRPLPQPSPMGTWESELEVKTAPIRNGAQGI